MSAEALLVASERSWKDAELGHEKGGVSVY